MNKIYDRRLEEIYRSKKNNNRFKFINKRIHSIEEEYENYYNAQKVIDLTDKFNFDTHFEPDSNSFEIINTFIVDEVCNTNMKLLNVNTNFSNSFMKNFTECEVKYEQTICDFVYFSKVRMIPVEKRIVFLYPYHYVRVMNKQDIYDKEEIEKIVKIRKEQEELDKVLPECTSSTYKKSNKI